MTNLLTRMKEFIREEELCSPSDHILLAVSGGIDSMVMAHLMIKAGYNCGVAHCNFSLRGRESDEDEAFVRRWSEDHHLPFYSRRFDTLDHARRHGLSVQMAARELRHRWFRQVMHEHGYDRLALAHNRNDLAETILINLVRGTGLRGLRGMPARHDELIRPLLFATRAEIESWAHEKKVPWREDSSNSGLKYLRNRIRHQIIPLLEELNPSFVDTLAATAKRLAGHEEIFERYLEEVRPRLLTGTEERRLIPLDMVRQLPARDALLLELLTPYGFSPPTVTRILDALDAPPGRQFFSPQYRLVKDRDHLILTPLADDDRDRRFYVDEGTPAIETPLRLRFTLLDRTPAFRIPTSPYTAAVDAARITWPLVIRRWQPGDYFRPLGMKGMKKLSDFFIDRKLSLVEKEELWLITDGEKIIWIPGLRLDDRYKITDRTEKILLIEWIR